MIRWAVVAVAVAGGCKKKSDPEVECPPSVAIEIRYPGASPAEVEQAIVLPVEAAIARIESVSAIHAMAAEGRAVFEVEVAGRADAVERRLFAVIEELRGLPEGAEVPRVRRPPRFETLTLAVAGLDDAERIERELSRVEGVEAVVAIGAPAPEIRIIYDPSRLAALGISPDVLAAAIRSGTGELTGRVIETRSDGSGVRLGDVARVVQGRGEGPSAFAGGRQVVVFAIAAGDKPPEAARLRAAGLERLSPPIKASICPRAFGLGVGAITAVAPGDGVDRIAASLAGSPVAVIRGADLLDRGAPADVEIIALDRDPELAAALRARPGMDPYVPGVATAFVELSGDDAAALERGASEIAKAAAGIDGVTGIRELPAPATPEIRFKANRERLAALGLTPIDVSMAVQRATTGEVAAILRGSSSPMPVRVIAEGAGERLEEVVLTTARGEPVSLGTVAAIERGTQRPIYRRDRRRRHHLRIAVADRAAIAPVKAAATEIARSAGVEVTVTAGDL